MFFFQQTKSYISHISWLYSRDIPMIFPYLSIHISGSFFPIATFTLQGSDRSPSGSQIVQAADPSMSNFNLRTSSRQVSRWLSQHGPRSSHLKLEKKVKPFETWNSCGYIWVVQLSYPPFFETTNPKKNTKRHCFGLERCCRLNLALAALAFFGTLLRWTECREIQP